MTNIFVVHSETRLLLIPANEAERLLLAQLMENEIEMHYVSDKVNILGQTISGGVVIQKKNINAEVRENKDIAAPTDTIN
jgi:hypothetical protein